MRIFTAAILLAAAGCGGGSALYLDTDVYDVPGFRLLSAKEVQMSGQLMHSGTLEYSGSADIKQIFAEYVESMKGVGWVTANVDVQGDRAIGTLRKDNRTCTLEFVKSGGGTRAVIKVGTTK